MKLKIQKSGATDPSTIFGLNPQKISILNCSFNLIRSIASINGKLFKLSFEIA